MGTLILLGQVKILDFNAILEQLYFLKIRSYSQVINREA